MKKKANIDFIISTLKLKLNTGYDKQIFEVLQHLKQNYEIKLSGGTIEKINYKTIHDINLKHIIKIKSTKFLYLQILTWIETILYIFFKIKIKNSYLSALLQIEKENNSIIFLQDIIFAPYLLIKEFKNKIYFGITDAQSLRFYNLLKIEKNIFKKIYYLTSFTYVIFVEKFIFKKAVKIQTYGYLDYRYLVKNHNNICYVPIIKDYEVKNFQYSKTKEFNIILYGNFTLTEQKKYFRALMKLKTFERISLFSNIRIIGKPPKQLRLISKLNIKYDFLSEIELKKNLNLSDIIILFDEVRSGMSNRTIEAIKSGSFIIGTKASFNGLIVNNKCLITNDINLWVNKILEISNSKFLNPIVKNSTYFEYKGASESWDGFFYK